MKISSIGAGKNSIILIDAYTLKRLGQFLKGRLRLEALDDFISEPEFLNCRCTYRKIFFTYSKPEEITPLHAWAFKNGWASVETRPPYYFGKDNYSPRMTNGSEIAASLANCAIQGTATHAFIMTNDIFIVPMLRTIREIGITVSLIYCQRDNFGPFPTILTNVDECIEPLEIPDFFQPFDLQNA